MLIRVRELFLQDQMDSHTTDAGHWTGIGILWLFWMFPVLIAGGNQTVFLQISNERPARYCEYCTCKNTPDGILTNCTELGFVNPPRRLSENTSELILKKNSIQVVQYKYLAGLYNLKILDLSENKISEIEHGAFKDLNNLTHLYMNGQRAVLFILQNVFEPGVFEGLDSLKILYIHENVDTREADASRLPEETLSNLTALEELRIDGLPNITFGENFNKLKDLKRLIMSGKSGTCLIRYLGRESFVGLENIEELTLEDCRIKQISNGTFWWTSRLKYLDLSWNTEIEIYNFGPVFAELKYTQLKVLKINAIHNPYRAGTEILRGNLRDLRDVKLIELHMNDNGIEFIDYGVFQMFPSTLKRLYMRRNKLNFGLQMFEAVFNNPNLKVFDAGDQAVGDRSDRAFTKGFNLAFEKGLRPFFRTKRKATKRYGEIQMYPRSDTAYHSRSKRQEHATISLEVLICSGSLSDIRPLDFKDTTNNISFVDLSRNYLPFIHYRAFFGLYKLKYLNLSHNYAEKIHSEAFGGLETVEILDLENNLFGNALNEDRQGKLFYPFKLLKKINLSRNRIYKIDKNVLFHTVNLEELNLSDNYLENLNIDLSHLKSLKVLDLSINRLQTLPESVTNVLSMLANFHKVHVNLKQNNLDCNCESIHFLKWIFTSSIIFDSIDMYHCSFNNGSRRIFNETRVKLLESLEEECKSYLDVTCIIWRK